MINVIKLKVIIIHHLIYRRGEFHGIKKDGMAGYRKGALHHTRRAGACGTSVSRYLSGVVPDSAVLLPVGHTVQAGVYPGFLQVGRRQDATADGALFLIRHTDLRRLQSTYYGYDIRTSRRTSLRRPGAPGPLRCVLVHHGAAAYTDAACPHEPAQKMGADDAHNGAVH